MTEREWVCYSLTVMPKKTETTAGKKLVIVESPSKARTLGGFLGKDYTVLASYGHVRDLPKSKMGVDPLNGYTVDYIVPEKAEKHIKEIKAAARDASEIYLATDPDREGEAISWHIQSQLPVAKQKNTRRVAFHEITKSAVAESFSSPRDLDMNLVDAQQARRVLDRLVGYELSPLLWKKVIFGLSAGRVQSVAVRLIVDRERERQAFKAEEYWSVDVVLAKDRGRNTEDGLQKTDDGSGSFVAGLVEKNDKKVEVENNVEADKIVADLEKASYQIKDVARSERKRSPYAPFTTSTLQQAAGNTLGMSAKKTMDAAQKLFEAGLITYHRTDSTNLSPQFIEAVRTFIGQEYGDKYLPEKPIAYATKSKNAQEAHEAIRPTDVAKSSLGAHDEQARVYELIWQRAVRSQMMPAVYDVVTVNVAAGVYGLRSTGSSLKFDGCLRAGGLNDEEIAADVKILRDLRQDQEVFLLPPAGLPDGTRPVKADQHFTEPPARYTESSLVKILEEYGIGRPSTYAPTIQTIQTRGYVAKEGRALLPKEVAFVVNDLLVKHFPDVVDFEFTAKVESELDEVAEGARQWIPVVKEFYEPFHKEILAKDKELKKSDFVNLGSSDKTCPECGKPLIFKLGRYGKFLSCSGWPDCKYAEFSTVEPPHGAALPEDNTSDAEISDQLIGGCPTCGSNLVLKTGPFGKFIACENYPKCKFTKPILHKIGLKCPKCAIGEVVKKFTKRKRMFFGCSRYPECDYASWNDPRLPEPEKKPRRKKIDKPEKSEKSDSQNV